MKRPILSPPFFLFFMTIFIITLAVIPPLKATTVTWEYYNSNDDNYVTIKNIYWKAQTFTVGDTPHTITSVKLKMYRENYPKIMEVSITLTDGSGHPSGSTLLTAITNASTFTTNTAGFWYEIDFGQSYWLNANVKYAIVVRCVNATDNDAVHWRSDSSSPTYSGGNVEQSSNSGGSWSSLTNADAMFEVYGDVSAFGSTQQYYAPIINMIIPFMFLFIPALVLVPFAGKMGFVVGLTIGMFCLYMVGIMPLWGIFLLGLAIILLLLRGGVWGSTE